MRGPSLAQVAGGHEDRSVHRLQSVISTGGPQRVDRAKFSHANEAYVFGAIDLIFASRSCSRHRVTPGDTCYRLLLPNVLAARAPTEYLRTGESLVFTISWRHICYPALRAK